MAWGMHGGLQGVEGSRSFIEQKEDNRINFYLGDDQSSTLNFKSSPFDLRMKITPDARIGPWGMTLNPEHQPDWINAKVGVKGYGTSGQISPWGNLNINPFRRSGLLRGLNFNVFGQRFPGSNFNLVNPSIEYQRQFNTPLNKWLGPLNVNLSRQSGGDISGMLSFESRGDR